MNEFTISNIRLETKSDPKGKDAAKSAEDRKKKATETMDEAWVRVLAMKSLSDNDRKKLVAVKNAMAEGIIGREPVEPGKKQKAFSKAEAMRLHVELAAMQREQKLADLVKNTPENYILVTEVSELRKLVGRAFYEEVLAVDTETTGLDVYADVIVGISLTLPSEDKHYYIPIMPTEDDRAMDPEVAFKEIAPLIESEQVGKVLHNALFDMAMFRRHGIKFRGLRWDTQTAMHILNENEADKVKGRKPGSYKLKDLAPKYLKVESDTFDELFGKNAKFAEIPLDIALVYAAKDTDLTWKLYKYQKYHMERFPSMYEYYTTVEVPLLYVISALEDNGYVLDLEFAREYGEALRKDSDALYAQLIELLRPHIEDMTTFNLNSGDQLKPVLEAAIGMELPNLQAKKTLKPLRKQYKVIDLLLSYRKIKKLSSTYIDKLPDKQNAVTKRWHSRFNTMGTVTGRFSSGKDKESDDDSGFNVQNQPEEARKMFLAPEGKVIIGADFKAQEIRCVAHLSGETVLIDAFNNGLDPYATLASEFHGRPYEEVYKNPDGTDTPERKAMKVGMLAAIYGTSKWTLAEQLGTTPDEAQLFLDRMFAKLPKLKKWIDDTQEFAAKHGFVWMDKEQRKRRLPDAKLKASWGDKETWQKVNRAKRQGPNARVQGSSSIQTKVTMIRAHELCESKDGWKLWGSVHDELLFEVPEDITREEVQLIEDVMINSYQFGVVPNGSDLEVMRVWGEGVPVEKWFKNKEAA